MPTRLLREGINSSSRINALSLGAEILYRRLISVVDDYGRYYAAPGTVRGACWPTSPEKIHEAQLMEWLSECSNGDRPLIRMYYVNGCKYLEITDFGQKIRSKSKFPDPCGQYESNLLTDCGQSADNLSTTCQQSADNLLTIVSKMPALDVVEVGDVVECEDGDGCGVVSVAKAPAKRGSRLGHQMLPGEWAAWSLNTLRWEPYRAQQTWEKFHDYWVAKTGRDATKMDWFATWRNWCKNENERSGSRNQQQYESATERTIKRAYELHEQGLL